MHTPRTFAFAIVGFVLAASSLACQSGAATVEFRSQSELARRHSFSFTGPSALQDEVMHERAALEKATADYATVQDQMAKIRDGSAAYQKGQELWKQYDAVKSQLANISNTQIPTFGPQSSIADLEGAVQRLQNMNMEVSPVPLAGVPGMAEGGSFSPSGMTWGSDKEAILVGEERSGIDGSAEVIVRDKRTGALTEVIPLAGGEISATGADGTRYTLTIPEGVLPGDLEISMTPISACW